MVKTVLEEDREFQPILKPDSHHLIHHPLPVHGVSGVGMFFIRRRLFTRLQSLFESVRERERKTYSLGKHLFIGI